MAAILTAVGNVPLRVAHVMSMVLGNMADSAANDVTGTIAANFDGVDMVGNAALLTYRVLPLLLRLHLGSRCITTSASSSKAKMETNAQLESERHPEHRCRWTVTVQRAHPSV